MNSSRARSALSRAFSGAVRPPYPKVYPKYQNPADPSQTWTGRGRTPRWISEMRTAGKSIDDLRINANET